MIRFLRLLCLLVAVGVVASSAFAAVAPPRAHPYGASYGQLAGDWTRWAVEMPASSSPFTGTAGCGEHQRGRVFFLPVQFGPGASFVCRVTAGRALLASPMGSICSTAGGDGTTPEQLRACARSIFPFVSHVAVSVDGTRVRDARRWRFVSPLLVVTLPADNILGGSAGPTSAIGGGWFYLIRPLPVGSHLITTSATLEPPFGPVTVHFRYRIKVIHPR
jgi:hypothetical protein